MGHHIESTVARCQAIDHVQSDAPCTWLRVSDVNDASAINLHGSAVRVLAQALAEFAATRARVVNTMLATPRQAADLEIARDLARWMGIDQLDSIMLPVPFETTDNIVTKE